MSEVIFFRGDRPPGEEPEPVPLGEAVVAGIESVRLAWSADPMALTVVVVAYSASALAQVAELVSSGSALEAVTSGGRRLPTRRLLVAGGVGLIALAGRNAGMALHWPLREAVTRRADARLLDIVAAMELADVENPEFQDRLQRAFSASRSHAELVNDALAIPSAGLAALGALLAMSARDLRLVPLSVAGAVPQWLLTRNSRDPSSAWHGHARGFREAMMLRRYLTGATAGHELRVFGATPYFRARHDELADSASQSQAAIMRQNARRDLLSSLAGAAFAGPAAVRLTLRAARREASVPDALTSGLAVRKLGSGIQRVVGSVAGLRRAAATTRDYREFGWPAAVAWNGESRVLPRDFSSITVENLTFTYPGGAAPVLHGVDLTIERGEVVALVGENGSGKTTLAKLLCALYRPDKGTIRWDDVDVAECDPAAVRLGIAVVFQDFVRYSSLTAAENIGIGMPSRMQDRDAIVAAAKRAGAHEAIVALSKGYETVMSRPFGGSELSSGQWQRVALARAFLRDAPFVVLDEPTAALDPRAERNLFETVASLYRSRSALLISHRLSSVRFADRICVLAHGRIIESGAHEHLVSQGGAYAELFEMQARSYR